MKITGIEIGEYRQFKNIKFDFTYPAGHPKEGKPLEKVCFIGQSGTGKTTLLKIVEEYFKTIDFGLSRQKYIADRDAEKIQRHRDDTGMFFYEYIQNTRINALFNNNTIVFDRFNNSYNSERGDLVLNWLQQLGLNYKDQDNSKLCLYIPDYVSLGADSLLKSKDDQRENSNFIKSQQELYEEKSISASQLKRLDLAKIISLSDINYSVLWDYIIEDINNYDQKIKAIAVELIQGSNSFSTERLLKRLADWKASNSNPRIELANKCVNPILNKFYLEMDTENTEIPIVLKNKQNVNIPNKYLSTGTKQILATAIPIHKIASSNSVILFDEPERSLFPDIQRELVKYYTSLAPEAQFFFATHSPIIASAFEPCERFILYFDENGEVNYHTGVAPEGDDPNDILRQDFAMAELMLQKGLDEYERYRQLAMQIRAETDEEKKNQLIVERLELGNRYNFAGQYAQSK